MPILFVAGSPSPRSRTQLLLEDLAGQFVQRGQPTRLLALSQLPPQALLAADAADTEIASALADIAAANVIVIGTPIYKASFSGLLKVFLDLLPQSGLKEKLILPIGTAGSNAHFLALDYGLRPVLQSLGAHVVLPSIFATENQVVRQESGSVLLDRALTNRLTDAIEHIGTFASARHSSRRYTSASGMCIDPTETPVATAA